MKKLILLTMAVVLVGCASSRTADFFSLEVKKDENGIRRAYLKGEDQPYSGTVIQMIDIREDGNLHKRGEGLMIDGLPVTEKTFALNKKLMSYKLFFRNLEDRQVKEETLWWTDRAGFAGAKKTHKKWDEKGELIFSKEWDRDGDQESIRGWKMDGTKE